MMPKTQNSLQVADDLALLDLMLDDQRSQLKLYATTNYYRAYDVTTIPYLRDVGLTNFRSVAPTTISSFGAVDSRMPPLDDTAIRRLMYYHAERYGYGSSARPLSEVRISRIGRPADYFEIEGRGLTPRSLTYYMRYGYVGRHLDWATVNVVAEIGSGVGTQAEIIASLHPNVALLLFDIPAPLYVCESYLKAVFGNRVVSYRENRAVRPGFHPTPGNIYLFGNWQLEILKSVRPDLFWSAACLCATEPDVAENYLNIINRSSVPAAYLMENFNGLFTAPAPGAYGVMDRTTMKNYATGLSGFELADRTPHYFEDGSLRDEYEHTFWRRKNGGRRRWQFPGLKQKFPPKSP
jgi:putative sugar O-methyltransferase